MVIRQTLPGEGMPWHGGCRGKKGDLHVRVIIQQGVHASGDAGTAAPAELPDDEAFARVLQVGQHSVSVACAVGVLYSVTTDFWLVGFVLCAVPVVRQGGIMRLLRACRILRTRSLSSAWH